MSEATDATRCKVCGGPFSAKRIIIDGAAYHERCSIISHPPHTWEDYARLSAQLEELADQIKARDAQLFAAELEEKSLRAALEIAEKLARADTETKTDLRSQLASAKKALEEIRNLSQNLTGGEVYLATIDDMEEIARAALKETT